MPKGTKRIGLKIRIDDDTDPSSREKIIEMHINAAFNSIGMKIREMYGTEFIPNDVVEGDSCKYYPIDLTLITKKRLKELLEIEEKSKAGWYQI